MGDNSSYMIQVADLRSIFNAVEGDSSLDEYNVVDKIKEKLKERDEKAYKRWRHSNDSTINCGLSLQYDDVGGGTGTNFLSTAITNRNPKVLLALLRKEGVIVRDFPIYLHLNTDIGEVDCEQIVEFLVAYEIKLQPSELTFHLIRQGYHNYLPGQEIQEYWNRCQDEVKRMKKEKVYDNVTFYDVLIGGINGLTYGTLNRVLRKDDYKSKFPIYAGDIERQFKIGNRRLDALNVGEITIGKIVAKHMGKESPFNLKIAEYLSNGDIKSLRKAAIQVMDGYDESYGEGTVASLIHQEGSQSDSRLNDADMGNFNRPEKTRKSLEIGIVCGVIAALIVGTGCGIAGAELSILAIASIAVAVALTVGFVAGGIIYLVLKPSDELDKPDLEVAGQQRC